MGLRYFNVYGLRQDPLSSYAGVISKFISMIEHQPPLAIWGDGTQTRDFILVKDIDKVNIQALQNTMTGVCNVATDLSGSLLNLVEVLSGCVNQKLEINHRPSRDGDISFSEANISKHSVLLQPGTLTPLHEGLSCLNESTSSLSS